MALPSLKTGRGAVLVIILWLWPLFSFDEFLIRLLLLKVSPAQRPDKIRKERILPLAEEMLSLSGRSDPAGACALEYC
jgi:hypothetical protein